MGRESSVMRDEFELSLELSIGGCYSKSENKNLVGEKGINDDVNLEVSRSDFSGGENGNDVGGGNVCEFADPLRRREIRALKRREARMKQSRGGLNNGGGLVEEKLIFEGGGEERETDESAAKREKIDAENLSVSVVRVSGAQFPSPVGKGFAWGSKVFVAGERDGKSSGDEPENAAAQPSSSVVSLHRSTCSSQRGGSSSDSGSHSSSFGTHQNSSSKTSRTVMEEGSTVRKRLHSNLTGNAEKPSPPPTSSAIPKLPSPSCLENGASMPRVSTTGNGPNGKTITGFLYKYMESEVRIMCACHGSFFSPAEFVEHAGGVNVTNPLRHITVDPRTVKR